MYFQAKVQVSGEMEAFWSAGKWFSLRAVKVVLGGGVKIFELVYN